LAKKSAQVEQLNTKNEKSFQEAADFIGNQRQNRTDINQMQQAALSKLVNDFTQGMKSLSDTTKNSKIP
jgi:hypothetical protein